MAAVKCHSPRQAGCPPGLARACPLGPPVSLWPLVGAAWTATRTSLLLLSGAKRDTDVEPQGRPAWVPQSPARSDCDHAPPDSGPGLGRTPPCVQGREGQDRRRCVQGSLRRTFGLASTPGPFSAHGRWQLSRGGCPSLPSFQGPLWVTSPLTLLYLEATHSPQSWLSGWEQRLGHGSSPPADQQLAGGSYVGRWRQPGPGLGPPECHQSSAVPNGRRSPEVERSHRLGQCPRVSPMGRISVPKHPPWVGSVSPMGQISVPKHPPWAGSVTPEPPVGHISVPKCPPRVR